MLGSSRGGARARALVLALSLSPAVAALGEETACAQVAATDKARAADAYERGRIANERGDFARAARELALADSLVPDPVTLRVALRAATLADDAVLGTELLERAAAPLARAPMDRQLAGVVAEARLRFAHRTGRVVVLCPEAVHCMATIDGAATTPGETRIVSVGVHTVGVQGNGLPEQRMLDVGADQTVTVGLPAQATPVAAPTPLPPVVPARPRSPAPTHGGASPLWFLGAAVITAGAGAITIVSALDTANRHADFDSSGCARAPASGCSSLAGDGLSAQRRTDALLIGTAVLAASTATLGVFFTRWTGGRDVSVGLGPREAFVRASF
jgi:hypothetical protein